MFLSGDGLKLPIGKYGGAADHLAIGFRQTLPLLTVTCSEYLETSEPKGADTNRLAIR